VAAGGGIAASGVPGLGGDVPVSSVRFSAYALTL